MKYLCLALLFVGSVTHLYSAEMPEDRVTFNNSFGLNWEHTLNPVHNTRSFVRSLTGMLAVILGSGHIIAFDEKTGSPLRQIALPSSGIGCVESLGDNRLVYAQEGQDALNIVSVGRNAAEKSTLTRVPVGISIYGIASIPDMKKLVVGGMSKSGPSARLVDFNTASWQTERSIFAGDGLVDGMSALPEGKGLVGYRRRYDSPIDLNLNVYDAKTGFTQPVRVPAGHDILTGEAIKGNNVLMWVRKNGGYGIRLYRNARDLNREFPTDPEVTPADLLDEGRGTIVVGINQEVTTMNTSGRILQKIAIKGFDIQNVKYIADKDGNDLIAVASAHENLLKLSVFGLRRIKARL